MSCACGCKGGALTDEQKKILEALANMIDPCGTKEVVAATGLDNKLVTNRITEMKKQGLIGTPVRCKHAITQEGRAALKC
jgi:predicted transcriptional regulator